MAQRPECVSVDDSFRCRKCRVYLFSHKDLTDFHAKLEQCSCWYLNSDIVEILPWIKHAIDQSQWREGKLYCPNCLSRVGAFNITQGVKCSCLTYVIPAVWIQKCKVDHVTSCHSKPNIRLPGKPSKPESCYRNDLHGETSSLEYNSHHNNTDSNNSLVSQTGHENKVFINNYMDEFSTSQSGFKTGQTSYCVNQAASTNQVDMQINDSQLTIKHNLNNANETPELDYNILQSTCQTCQTGFCLNSRRSVSSFRRNDRRLHEKTKLCLSAGISHQHLRQMARQDLTSNEIELKQDLYASQTQPRCHGTCNCQGHTITYVCECKKRNLRKRSNAMVSGNVSHSKAEQDEESTGDGYLECDQHIEEETDTACCKEREIPEHLICPICLDLLYEPLISPCDHVFCDTCLRILNSKCSKMVPRCPLCRKSLNYVYPAVELRDKIRKYFYDLYRERHKVERRASHRRLPLPSGRRKTRKQKADTLGHDIPMPYSVLIFLVCVLAVCVLCLVILFVFCPPSSNRCVTIIGYD